MESVEAIVTAITHTTVKVNVPIVEPPGLNRQVYFTVNSEEYMIEWWCNICYLHVGDLLVIFDKVMVSSSWPNSAKYNLQFYYNGEICAVIPIQYWS